MFSAKCNFPKLKTNLRLTVNRLKLLEKKKTELALKARREIADYIQAGKEDRARIRVEHIVREDFTVEALEMLEMFCDLLLARFGIIERVAALDPSIEEAVATVIWSEPRLSADIPELTIISKNLQSRYGKEFHDACKQDVLNNVNDKLKRKMSIYSPPKMLIESYMVEIARSFNVDFTPDQMALCGEDGAIPTGNLLEFNDFKADGGIPTFPSVPTDSYPTGGPGGPPSGSGGPPPPGPPGGGPGGMNYPPGVPSGAAGYPPGPPVGGPSYQQRPPGADPFNYPPVNPGGNPPPPHPHQPPAPPVYSEKPGQDQMPPNYSSINVKHDAEDGYPGPAHGQPGPVSGHPGPVSGHPGAPGASAPAPDNPPPDIGFSLPDIPGSDDFNLPSVPGSVNPGNTGNTGGQSGDIDFDDLAARFENLKKRK